MPINDLVYVGTYSEPILFGTGQVLQGKGKGIYCFPPRSRERGALEPVGVTEGVRNSSYLAFDPTRKFLYCVNEFKEFEGKASGAVSAFRIDQDTGALTFLNMKASHGTDPCHLIVDKTGKNVLIANFASGSVCVLPIKRDGSLKEASCVIQHEGTSVDPKRQAGPHAHAVELSADNRFAFVPELGGDKVMIYELDAERGKLTPNKHQPFIKMAPGAGPRQLVMHPNGKFAYLINELNSTMTAYRYDAIERHADGDPDAADAADRFLTATARAAPRCRSHPSGKFLYGSNRGHNSIVIYGVDPASGKLTLDRTRERHAERSRGISRCIQAVSSWPRRTRIPTTS